MSAAALWSIALGVFGLAVLLAVVILVARREMRKPFPERDDYPVETGDEDPPLQRGPRP